MFGIGLGELVLIIIVALIFISPEKLPEVTKTAAKALRELRKTGNEFKRSLADADITKIDITNTGAFDAPASVKAKKAEAHSELQAKAAAAPTDESGKTT